MKNARAERELMLRPVGVVQGLFRSHVGINDITADSLPYVLVVVDGIVTWYSSIAVAWVPSELTCVP
jgi:hypothetical protein